MGIPSQAQKIMSLTEAEKSYFAGLFDGEGCVGYYVRYTAGRPYHSASLHVCMTEKQAPYWILSKTGYGKVSVSVKPDNHKTVYSWQLCNKPQIQEVLTAIRPYLLIKSTQVDLLFALWRAEEALPKRNVTPELVLLRQKAADEMKLLKQPFWEGVETRRAQPLRG